MSSSRPEWWVAKVPSFLFEEWESIASRDPMSVVGTLLVPVASDGSQPAPRTMKLVSESSGENDDMFPTDYEFEIREEYLDSAPRMPDPVVVLSGGDSGEVRNEGKLAVFADIKPPAQDERYKARKRHSMMAALSKSKPKKTTLLETTRPIQYTMQVDRTLKTLEPVKKKEPKDYYSNLKRAKMPEEELLVLIYRLFEKQEFWRFKDLQDRLEQPQDHLKKVLEKVCINHKSGPHIHHYSLKEEFRIRSES